VKFLVQKIAPRQGFLSELRFHSSAAPPHRQLLAALTRIKSYILELCKQNIFPEPQHIGPNIELT
jgi:hypothetical protein